MRLTTTKDAAMTRLRALVYGDSGIGKTTSLRTLPEKFTAIAAAERGLIPLREYNYPVYTLESWEDMQELVKVFREPVTVDGRPIKVLGIDSLSELSDFCKQKILHKDRPELLHERTHGKSEKPAGVYDDLMTMEDWGLYRTRMTNMLSAACHLPVHVIFTSLAAWVEDKRTGGLFRTPNMNGKLALECPAFFDVVLHMESMDTTDGDDKPIVSRVWRTAHDGRIIAKDASGVLDPFEPADWTALMRKIAKNGNGNGKAVTT